MDAARQVVRWSIPGWIFILMIASLEMLTLLAQGKSLQSIVTSTSLHDLSPAAVALIVTAGIPLGFVMYQVYYSMYGRVLFFHLVNRDRGGEIVACLPEAVREKLLIADDCKADLEGMYDEVDFPPMPHPLRRLKREFRNEIGRKRYQSKVQGNWDIVRFWLNYLCIKHEAEPVKHEVTNLADIYHGIGAARVALLGACILHFVYNVLFTNHDWLSWRMLLALTVPYLFALWLLRVLERTRTHSLNSLQSMLKHAFLCFFSDQYKELGAFKLAAEEQNVA
jgi:hypothetical protein